MKRGSSILILHVTLALLVGRGCADAKQTTTTTPLMDSKGNLLNLPAKEIMSGMGITTLVTSPGTPSRFDEAALIADLDDKCSLLLNNDVLVCRGSTLLSSSSSNYNDDESSSTTSLALCSVVSQSMVLDGITEGDVDSACGGLRKTRHARSLTTLFRTRLLLCASSDSSDSNKKKQTLILVCNDDEKGSVEQDVKLLFAAVAAEQQNKGSSSKTTTKTTLEDLYNLRITASDPSSVMFLAKEAAKVSAKGGASQTLANALQTGLRQVREAGVLAASDAGLEPPHIANAFCSIHTASVQQSKSARARMASWKSRVARGLLVDGFGREATALRQRVLSAFDAETIAAAGLPSVASYRAETRLQLQQLLDTSIQQVYAGQVANLEKSTWKRFNAALLKTVNSKDSVESVMDINAAALRKEALMFETVLGDMEVPKLGLTKEKSVRELTSKLNDALNAFPDSPAAKLKRAKQVKQVVSKEKKPGQASVGFGVDLVAMLRPDGFGSLQGYAGYQLPGGNSVTFGVHNDADDPQVIAQFGGVRPPLLRVQPKLRVDVEM